MPDALSQPKSAPADRWWPEAQAVFVKDVRSELRTRAAVTTILLFALVVLMITAFLNTTEGFGLTQVPLGREEFLEALKTNPNAQPFKMAEGTTQLRGLILSALLWIVLFFSAVAGLPRIFVKEEEMRTAPALRLAARPSAVFTGKLMINAVLMLLVVAVILLPFLILFRPIVADWALFLASLPVGALGLAGGATLVGAMSARAGGKTYLMLPLSFPIVLPVLIMAINTTAAALTGSGSNHLVPLVSYLVLMVTASSLLFGPVWSD